MGHLFNAFFGTDRTIGLRYASLAKILLSQDVGCHLRPRGRHLHIIHLKHGIARWITDNRRPFIIFKKIKYGDTLKTNLATVNQKATTLEKQNQELNTKVQAASALKIGAASVTAYKIKGSGKEVDVTRAGSAKKIKINFTVASNPVAEKGTHDVFLRILDPTGNLITTAESATFNSDGQDLQYTYKTAIEYKDDGSPFVIDWVSPNTPPFQKRCLYRNALCRWLHHGQGYFPTKINLPAL